MVIPPWATVAVLGGAALHAAWNVGIRGGADRRLATVAMIAGSALSALVVLPFFPAIDIAGWHHLLVSMVFHTIYLNLVAEAYARGAVSLIYPLMRGLAPALTAMIATFAFGETLGVAGWTGLLLISSGVGLLAHPKGTPGEGRAVLLALANAVIIALYTSNDAIGARVSHAAITYALWTFILPALPACLILLRLRVSRLVRVAEPGRLLRQGLGGGACSVASYTLALWAMTVAPIGAVAALRETSMLFGVLFAWWFLREQPGRRGLVAVAVITAGAVVLRLG